MQYLSPVSLQIYKEVIEAKSFRAAARNLQISQPAVSAHIQRLEKTLGTSLFNKPYRKTLSPTEAGNLLYRYVVDYSAMNIELMSNFVNLHTGKAGKIQFASSVCQSLFLEASAKFLLVNPNASLLFRSGSSMEVQNMVQEGTVDFGIMQETSPDPNFEKESLFEASMQLFCATGHPLAGKENVSLKDISEYSIVKCMDGSDYNNRVDIFLQQIGYAGTNHICVEDGSLLPYIIEHGDGIALLSEISLASPYEQGRIARIKLDPALEKFMPKTKGAIIFRKTTHVNPVTRNFLDYLHQYILPTGKRIKENLSADDLEK